MPTIQEFVRLRCVCGGELFSPILYLRWRPGAGTHPEPMGHRCHGCNGVVNAAELIKLAQLRQKTAELRAAQAELEAEAPEIAKLEARKGSGS